ncbi:hypothetical protein N7527_009955 [Penicillium freii]|nr:hypothetical protein N7527_009955 [Penicillium freii]
MTCTPFNDYYDIYRSRLPDLWERTPSWAPTPGYLHREYTLSVICPSPDAEDIQLIFYHAVAGQDRSAWNEQPADCIQYQIEWRVKLNNRVVAKDTEQDLTLPPTSYWEQIKEDTEGILRRKIACSRRFRLDDTALVLSVNDRTQRDIAKLFEGSTSQSYI